MSDVRKDSERWARADTFRQSEGREIKVVGVDNADVESGVGETDESS